MDSSGITAWLEKAYNGDLQSESDFFSKIRVRIASFVEHRVQKYARTRKERGVDPEDIVQDVLTVIIQKYNDHSLPLDHLLPWILTVTWNKILQYYRNEIYGPAKRRASIDNLALFLAGEDNPEDSAILNESKNLIKRALRKMQPHCKEVIESLMSGTIKEYLNKNGQEMPKNAVYQRIHRCRQQLKSLLEKGQ